MGNSETRRGVVCPPEHTQPGRFAITKAQAQYWVNYFTSDTTRLWSERDYRNTHLRHATAMGADIASVYGMLHTSMPERFAFLGAALVASAKVIPSALRLGEYHIALEKRRKLQRSKTYGPASIHDLVDGIDHFEQQLEGAPDEYRDAILAQRFGPIFESELIDLGFHPMRGRIDRKRSNSFQKEDNPSLPTDGFSIVNDREGQWLLKELSHNPLRATYQEVAEVVMAQEEEIAYRVADFVGYPVPETKKVIYKGSPCIAYRYVPHAIDFDAYKRQEKTDGSIAISNPEDLLLRPWFNALVGAYGDSADQGIVDLDTGHYSANDVRFTLERRVPEMLSDQDDLAIARAGFSEKARFSGYGVPEPLEETSTVSSFLQRVNQLGEGGYVQYGFPPRLQQRARTLSFLMKEALR